MCATVCPAQCIYIEAGEYEFYCPVGNHKDAGMEGTLTVN
jgi:uncharacterized cupredoxin-like copper-binding protein